MNPCPLCGGETELFHRLDRDYRFCRDCGLVSVPEEFHPSRRDERVRYEHHENSLEDARYLGWLQEAVRAVEPYLEPGDEGLDYGSGPVAAMRRLFRGHKVATYDPFFFPDEAVLRQKFDFLIAHEVVEHFRRPADEWSKMASLVKSGGILAIRTELLTNRMNFSEWHYRRDVTHLGFYRRETLQWLAEWYGWQILHQVGAVTVYRVA